jgi:poly(hydroxyalkanoate) depolymerase family esterase
MERHKIFSDGFSSGKVKTILPVIAVGMLFFFGFLILQNKRKEEFHSPETIRKEIQIVVILQEVPDFGPNPGNLKMYRYIPAKMEQNQKAPLVVVLHGCTQTAGVYGALSGWNTLADRFGFYVLYAEQKKENHFSQCFKWWDFNDIRRGKGEAASIARMVAKMKRDYPIDSEKVFVTGLSAGGAMTSVMLAAYPDVFAGGGIMAGLPYYYDFLKNEKGNRATNPGYDLTPEKWGELVKKTYPGYKGTYPRVIAFHGGKDTRVVPRNLEEIREQWMAVHDLEGVEPKVEKTEKYVRRTYRKGKTLPQLETWLIRKMGHAIAVDPGYGKRQGGSTGFRDHAVDLDLFSSYEAARFWNIAP